MQCQLFSAAPRSYLYLFLPASAFLSRKLQARRYATPRVCRLLRSTKECSIETIEHIFPADIVCNLLDPSACASGLLKYPWGYPLDSALVLWEYRQVCLHFLVMLSLATMGSWTRLGMPRSTAFSRQFVHSRLQGSFWFLVGCCASGSIFVSRLVQTRYLFEGSCVFFLSLHGYRNNLKGIRTLFSDHRRWAGIYKSPYLRRKTHFWGVYLSKRKENGLCLKKKQKEKKPWVLCKKKSTQTRCLREGL